MHEPRPEIHYTGGGRGAVADAQGMSRKHERGKDDEVFDRVVVGFYQARGPGRLRLRVGGVADRFGEAPNGYAVQDVGNPKQARQGP